MSPGVDGFAENESFEERSTMNDDEKAAEQNADVDSSANETADESSTLIDGPKKSRNQKFRRELLTRLPKLHYSTWQVGDQFSVDDDLDDVVDLSADAVLKPLEKLVDRMDRQA